MPLRQLRQLVISHIFPLPPTEPAKSRIGAESDEEDDSDVPEKTTATGRKRRSTGMYDKVAEHDYGEESPLLTLQEHAELALVARAHSCCVL